MTEGRLQGRRVAIGISGGIAAYKAIEVIRLLTDAGAQVRVLMTPEATRFVTPLTLEAIESATPNQPTVQPVPYKGVQFLAIPEFQDLGTRVSQQISAAIADQKSVDAAVAQSQKYAAVVGATYRENK